ncbi:MAG: hypothetical protein BZY81_05340 [SAR202 cluster bacterium Io17-Chloro-G4]|nr:MAG: hypothetical protein BZY81_05340 [SAR202 cluster bacterium Io17-Chloro-G4]
MIPLTLSLKNFLSYRENVPTLDFAGIHVACLCGQNGHGKSALLDAITWCLWGKARGKTQDELISYGADECSVDLDFSSRDNHYRASRSHARGGGRRRQGATDLQLQVISDSGPTPISGNSVRETQAQIDQLVGMDYDTFTNSAFLLQGRADEFTNKTPSERKAVLSKILGLELYDRLQDLAKSKLSENSAGLGGLESALEVMRRQAEEIGDPAPQLLDVEEKLALVDSQLKDQALATGELRGKVAELERQFSQLEDVARTIEGLRQEVTQIEASGVNNEASIQKLQELLSQGDEIRQGAKALEKARGELNSLEEARLTFDRLGQTKQDLVRVIDTAKSRLEAQSEQLRLKVEVELPAKAQSTADLALQQEQTQKQLAAVAEEELTISVSRERQQNLSTRVGQAQSVAERYKTEGQELRSKLNLLLTTGHQEAVCPLCKTSLGEDGCGRLAETYKSDIDEKVRLYRLNESQLQELTEESARLERDLEQREKKTGESRRRAELKLNDLERQKAEAQLAQEELDVARVKLAEATASMASGDYASRDHAELKRVEAEIASVGYNEEARRKAYSQAQEMQSFADRAVQLADAETNLPRQQESALQNQDMLKRRRAELERLDEQHKTNKVAVESLPELRTSLNEAEAAQNSLDSQRQQNVADKALLEERVNRLGALNEEIAKESKRLTGLQEERGVYQELVNAFGRQGVQAMLIETVVPRLEEEANNLLGRMTDNRTYLRLETQRERRSGKGEPSETLEIQVNDDVGPRSYEMYSGGEAFRVNLALRIALSKVLAQRMGAPMPTLFIDEGFGTQDAVGRERILDVIGAIQDDFDKIIVITHLEELKDAFPVRIEVQKDAQGSTFVVSS